MKRKSTAIILNFIFLTTISWASSISVMPTRIFIDSNKKTSSIKVTNSEKKPITAQIQIMKWGQDDKGEPILNKANDIVFFPKMISLNKNESKTVRLGWKENQDRSIEKSYRLFVSELPTEGTKATLRMTLQFSIPIFFSPENAAPTGTVENISWIKEMLSMFVKNDGNEHLMVKNINIIGTANTGKKSFEKDIQGWYVLPGCSRLFKIPVTAKEWQKAKTVSITVNTDKLDFKKKVSVDKDSHN